MNKMVEETVHRCRVILQGPAIPEALAPKKVPGAGQATGHIPGFLTDLARVADEVESMAALHAPLPSAVSRSILNPTLRLVQVGWTGLPLLIRSDGEPSPEQGTDYVALWRRPSDGSINLKSAEPGELLIIKTLAEDISPETVAREHGMPLTVMNRLLRAAAESGLILPPPSEIRRPQEFAPAASVAEHDFRRADTFTLQWHITQACDLHCRHCYDRSRRAAMPLDRALGVLDDVHAFVSAKKVAGHVSFTGGNPLLYKDFQRLYAAAAGRGFEMSILGNPTSRETIRKLVSIQKPDLYQISLEGLREHNDAMRGEGHFDHALAFLDLLREEGVHAMVMLTLTRDNMDQVIPLARILRDRADTFHFNRLSPVGEGADLLLPDKEAYVSFLSAYLEETETNPILGLKDNLINILRLRRGEPLFGGCTGFGCGAAFNFLALLPDGEIHACRKFPSHIGNIFTQGLTEVYDSAGAQRYRTGCTACNECAIRSVCGGCLAVASGFGGDFSRDKDPFCFMEPSD